MRMILTSTTITILASLSSSETLAVKLETFSISAIAFLRIVCGYRLEVFIKILFGVNNQNVFIIIEIFIRLLNSRLEKIQWTINIYQIGVHLKNFHRFIFQIVFQVISIFLFSHAKDLIKRLLGGFVCLIFIISIWLN